MSAPGASPVNPVDAGPATRRPRGHKPPGTVTPRCPLRPDEPCTQCQAYATGPDDCGLVYLVLSDPDLLEIYREKRREAHRADHPEG
ncbi:DUF6767 domain-containing protein [Propionibacterium freudenreichii]|uniref:DUF6767 domain-containing protein n=1 Tax=Propionibacterium freudenreichii TaxID=1744 RepID=UPI0021A38DDB|nr:DUF6767 domain-containing protein [Propionibacterium freudenreichii]